MITTQDVAAWQDYVGRIEETTQYLDAVSLKRFLAVLGHDAGAAAPASVPEMAHWAYFLPMTANEDIGADGHPRRGGFMPPVPLPRRMFAGGSTRFHRPLATGAEATCRMRIAGVARKAGRAGDLVFVELERAVSQAGQTCLVENQTIVYRDAGGRVAPVERSDPAALEEPLWTPGPVHLFRFSAVTFNAHRIHYDAPYAREEEGYPGLVVHAPFTASMLCRLASDTAAGRRMSEFSFRATAPLFAGQPIRLRATPEGDTVKLVALRQDGQTAVSANATFTPKS